MQEKTITIVSVIIIVLGLSFLAFYMDEFKGQVVESIDNIPAAEKVFIQGRVNRVSLNDKVIFLEVEGKKIETMDIVVFGEDNLFIKEGDLVEISGIVEEYQGKKEVIAEEIVVKWINTEILKSPTNRSLRSLRSKLRGTWKPKTIGFQYVK